MRRMRRKRNDPANVVWITTTDSDMREMLGRGNTCQARAASASNAAAQSLCERPKSATCGHNRKTIMREENTETESTPTTPSGEQVGSTALFSRALRAICLTRDYVGEQLLPAIEGWEWYDAGVELMNAIPDDEWAEQFRLRTQPCPECQRPNPRHKDGCTTQMMREMHGESSGENSV